MHPSQISKRCPPSDVQSGAAHHASQVLDLKGTSKAEQNSVLDSFLTITSTKTDLETASFLSSLDMDPPSLSISSGNLASPGHLTVIGPDMDADTQPSPRFTYSHGVLDAVKFA
jgi:hypothetical protein